MKEASRILSRLCLTEMTIFFKYVLPNIFIKQVKIFFFLILLFDRVVKSEFNSILCCFGPRDQNRQSKFELLSLGIIIKFCSEDKK